MRRIIPFVIPFLLVASSGVPADELPRVQPKAVGLSEKVLAEIQPGLAKLVAEGKLAGAVVTVARHGKVALVGTVGHRDLASKSPMTEDTIFAIASMTKPITCVAAMMLVEDGKLSLDDPVEKFVPAFISQMLSNGGEFEGKRFLRRDTLTLMTSNQIGDHKVFGVMKYGLGFGLMMLPTPGAAEPVLDFFFWAGAFSTNFWVDPRWDIFGVVMTQVVPVTQITQFVQQTVNKAVEK